MEAFNANLKEWFDLRRFDAVQSACTDFELENIPDMSKYNPAMVNSFYCYYLSAMICKGDEMTLRAVKARFPMKNAQLPPDIAFLFTVSDLISRNSFNARSMHDKEVPAFIRDSVYTQILTSWRDKERYKISKVYEEISLAEFADRMFLSVSEANSDCIHFNWPIEGDFVATRPILSGAKEQIFKGAQGLSLVVNLVREIDQPSLRFDNTIIYEPTEAKSEGSGKSSKKTIAKDD